jgi:hypothetical protein
MFQGGGRALSLAHYPLRNRRIPVGGLRFTKAVAQTGPPRLRNGESIPGFC